MNLKKFILILFVLICCGCKAKYNIDFSGEKINEKLSLEYSSFGETNQELEEYYNDSIFSIYDTKFMNFSVNHNDSDSVGLDFSYVYGVENYNKSYLANNCFSNFYFYKKDNKYYYSAFGEFTCSTYEYIGLDSLDIVFTTDHIVIDNNADEVDGNRYIWHITSDNFNDVMINIVTDEKVNSTVFNKKFLLFVSIPFLILIFSIVFHFKRKKSNKNNSEIDEF